MVCKIVQFQSIKILVYAHASLSYVTVSDSSFPKFTLSSNDSFRTNLIFPPRCHFMQQSHNYQPQRVWKKGHTTSSSSD